MSRKIYSKKDFQVEKKFFRQLESASKTEMQSDRNLSESSKRTLVLPRIFSKISFAVIKRNKRFVFAVALTALVLGIGSMLMFKQEISAATYGWIQSTWTGGASSTTATHGSNMTNWTNYESTSGITASTDLKLERNSF